MNGYASIIDLTTQGVGPTQLAYTFSSIKPVLQNSYINAVMY